MSNNPNMQCQRCGKWRRLTLIDGNQTVHPYYIEDDDSSLVELYDCLCLQCEREIEPYKKDLLQAYKVGLEMSV